jgi:hypothetical protein
VLGASIIASSVALLSAVGCLAEETLPPAPATGGTMGGGSGGAGGVGGSGGTAGSSTGGSAPTTGGASGSGGSFAGTGSGGTPASGGAGTGGTLMGGTAGTGGATAGSGGANTGGTPASGGAGTGGTIAGSGGASAGTMGGAGKPCVDVEPPPPADWPDATCERWATETPECSAAWFAGYCDVSCGRCVPEGGGGGGGTGGAAPVDCSGEGLPNVTGGEGHATRYWDCCQTHCAQQSGHRCSQDGVSSTGSNQSACSGGGAFACYDEAPRAVSECLSYGHIAKSNPNCGGCYRIQFTGQGQHNANDPGSKLIKGKQMIVKVTNTGGDVGGSQFDLMIPGGGVGMFNACANQWGTNDLGAQYGGFLTECTGSHSAKKECVRQECMKIPAGRAREGCLWFVDWFQVADNPKFTSQSTNCPF